MPGGISRACDRCGNGLLRLFMAPVHAGQLPWLLRTLLLRRKLHIPVQRDLEQHLMLRIADGDVLPGLLVGDVEEQQLRQGEVIGRGREPLPGRGKHGNRVSFPRRLLDHPRDILHIQRIHGERALLRRQPKDVVALRRNGG